MKTATQAQLKVLLVIDRLIEAYGYSPTVREIAKECKRSSSTISAAIMRLRNHALVTWVGKGDPRTLRLTPEGRRAVLAFKNRAYQPNGSAYAV